MSVETQPGANDARIRTVDVLERHVGNFGTSACFQGFGQPFAEKHDERRQHESAQNGAGHHERCGARADDVADAQHFGSHVARQHRRLAEERQRHGHGACEHVEDFGESLVDDGDAEADEDRRPAGAAFLAVDEHLGAGSAFGVNQLARFARLAV